MAYFLTFILALLVQSKAHAGFSSSHINMGTITVTPKEVGKFNKITKAAPYTFTYTNLNSSPAILTLSSGSNGPCSISNLSSLPIAPGEKRSIAVNCIFNWAGYKKHQLGTIQVREKHSFSHVTLTIAANVVIKDPEAPEPEANDEIKEAAKPNAECADVDLNYSEPLKSMPTLDQDGVGICYAFVASALTEYELKKRGLSQRTVSPIDLAYMHEGSRNVSEWFQNGGAVANAFQAMKLNGVATRECIAKVMSSYTKDSSLSSEELLKLLSRFHGKNSDTIKAECLKENLSTKQIGDLISILSQPVDENLRTLFEDCEKERVDKSLFKKLSYSEASFRGGEQFQKILNKRLDNKKPSYVGICAQIVTGKKDYVGINPDGTKKEDCSGHAIMVTARRMNKGKCEYLIRNSWGGSWSRKDMTCACKTKNGYYPDCSKRNKKLDSAPPTMVGCWSESGPLFKNTSTVGGFN